MVGVGVYLSAQRGNVYVSRGGRTCEDRAAFERGEPVYASRGVAATACRYCALPRAERMAADWGAAIVEIGPRGHINGESGLGDWPEGLALLRGLAGDAR